ncbi:MAG: 23S rRNA pseudouridine955/2504/2580 synthase [Flavobacteriales bacterium]|jgi:23S rRNA pseudouridine955/2504/2580 synthase
MTFILVTLHKYTDNLALNARVELSSRVCFTVCSTRGFAPCAKALFGLCGFGLLVLLLVVLLYKFSTIPEGRMSNSVKFEVVAENSEGQRLDNFLLKTLKGVPKSLIYRIIRKGEVRVNKGRAKPETKLKIGDSVRIPPVRRPEEKVLGTPSDQLLQVLESAILYETKELIIVNKPAGLAVHGGSGISLGLIEAMRVLRPLPMLELVHRLDRDTSGCVMIAKKRSTLKYIQNLLRDKTTIEKNYLALVFGQWPKRKHVVDAPLLKREMNEGGRMVTVHPDGKASRTEFSIEHSYNDATLLNVKPITGRTHQIRVHAAHIGHSLVGDDKYSPKDLNQTMRRRGLKRMFLHAFNLKFTLPDGTALDINAPLPEEFQKGLNVLAKEQ